MSDDFATCKNCGAFDGEGLLMEQLKFDLLSSIFTLCVNKQNENFKDIEPEVEELVTEYVELCRQESQGIEGICKECHEYTSWSWQHVEYHKNKI